MGLAVLLFDIQPVNGICSEAQDVMYKPLNVQNACGVTAPTSCDTLRAKHRLSGCRDILFARLKAELLFRLLPIR